MMLLTWLSIGSPPRVRGIASEQLIVEAAHGITPACAGNSDGVKTLLREFGNHPRVCGE